MPHPDGADYSNGSRVATACDRCKAPLVAFKRVYGEALCPRCALPTHEQVAYMIDLAPNPVVPEAAYADARASIARAIAADRERCRSAAAPVEPSVTVDAVRQKLTAIMARLDLALDDFAEVGHRTNLVASAEEHVKAAHVAAKLLAGLCREAETAWRKGDGA